MHCICTESSKRHHIFNIICMCWYNPPHIKFKHHNHWLCAHPSYEERYMYYMLLLRPVLRCNSFRKHIYTSEWHKVYRYLYTYVLYALSAGKALCEQQQLEYKKKRKRRKKDTSTSHYVILCCGEWAYLKDFACDFKMMQHHLGFIIN